MQTDACKLTHANCLSPYHPAGAEERSVLFFRVWRGELRGPCCFRWTRMCLRFFPLTGNLTTCLTLWRATRRLRLRPAVPM
jgi:hypothetical protein